MTLPLVHKAPNRIILATDGYRANLAVSSLAQRIILSFPCRQLLRLYNLIVNSLDLTLHQEALNRQRRRTLSPP